MPRKKDNNKNCTMKFAAEKNEIENEILNENAEKQSKTPAVESA